MLLVKKIFILFSIFRTYDALRIEFETSNGYHLYFKNLQIKQLLDKESCVNPKATYVSRHTIYKKYPIYQSSEEEIILKLYTYKIFQGTPIQVGRCTNTISIDLQLSKLLEGKSNRSPLLNYLKLLGFDEIDCYARYSVAFCERLIRSKLFSKSGKWFISIS